MTPNEQREWLLDVIEREAHQYVKGKDGDSAERLVRYGRVDGFVLVGLQFGLIDYDDRRRLERWVDEQARGPVRDALARDDSE
jgi:hypothetical protein